MLFRRPDGGEELFGEASVRREPVAPGDCAVLYRQPSALGHLSLPEAQARVALDELEGLARRGEEELVATL
ncbi:MAG: hypothetical protein ACRDM8_06680, partial [Gaiellaceae bacterium]